MTVTNSSTPGFPINRYVDPDWTAAPGGPDAAAGNYPGLDRFGCIARQVWSGPGELWGGGSPLDWDPDTRPAIFDLAYSYDHNSNITGRIDAREGASLNGRDESYSYDGLDRLTEALRVEHGSLTPRPRSQDWVLDMLGNWDEHNPDVTAATAAQLRAHNMANEVESITVNSSQWAGFVYDKAGNLTHQGTGIGARRKFVWDAWNRLREVQYQVDLGGTWAGSTRARHEYYGLHQRAATLADELPDQYSSPTRLNHYY